MQKPNALVTGASRGIGAATAIKLAEAGYHVVINYRQNLSAAKQVADSSQYAGGECTVIQADVSVEQDVKNLFTQIDQIGTLTALVNNAGQLQTQCRFDEISLERFQTMLNQNLVSAFLCCQQAVKRMSTRFGGVGGAIVNVSSGASRSGSPFEYVDYAASKGGLDTLTRGLSLEVANECIRVNGVRPGLIETEMHASGGEPERVARLSPNIPMKRGGTAEEVADAIAFLVSDKSSFTTGSFIDTTGGLMPMT